jgi:transcriptional regulator with XRE-family HTH domain
MGKSKGSTNSQEFAIILGGVLREHRRKARETISSVAEETGLTAFAVADIESGRDIPATGDLALYAAALDTTPRALLLRAWEVQELAQRTGMTVTTGGGNDAA